MRTQTLIDISEMANGQFDVWGNMSRIEIVNLQTFAFHREKEKEMKKQR